MSAAWIGMDDHSNSIASHIPPPGVQIFRRPSSQVNVIRSDQVFPVWRETQRESMEWKMAVRWFGKFIFTIAQVTDGKRRIYLFRFIYNRSFYV